MSRAVFGPFSFQLQTLELTKFGTNLRLEEKPARILACLIKDHGRIVSRQELRQNLWDEEVNVDFDHGLNKAVNKLRTVLGDRASEPQYLETLSRRGYRFVAEVRIIEPESAEAAECPIVVADLGHDVPSAMPARARINRHWIWATVAIALFAAILTIVLLSSTKRAPLPLHQRLTYDDGIVYTARFTPDGNTIVYGAAWNGEPFRLFWTREGSKESRRFDLPDADILSISRSGDMAMLLDRKWRWGFQPSGTLAVVPITGSSPRKLMEDVQYADWSPDGTNLAITHVVKQACLLEFPIGHVIYQGNGWLSDPRISPGGDFIAFFEHPITGNDSGVVLVTDRTGKKVQVWDGWSGLGGLAWEPTGKAIWFSGYRDGGQKKVYELALSGGRREVFGESGNVKLHDISRSGQVLLSVDDLRAKTFLHTKGDARVRDISLLDLSYATGLSPDGRTVLMNAWGDAVSQKEDEAYLLNISQAPIRLGIGRPWEISPDGKSVLAATPLGASGNFGRQLQLLPIGPGEPETLTSDSMTHSFATWVSPGKRIIFVGHEPGRPNRSWIQGTSGGSPRAITPEGVTGWVISPDGKTLATKDEQNRFWLYPIDGGLPLELHGPAVSDVPARWSNDPRFLFLSTDTTRLPVQVYRLDVKSGRREPLYNLSPADKAGFFGTGPIQITPDGKFCVNSYMSIHSVLYMARGIR